MKSLTIIKAVRDFFFKPQPVENVALMRIFIGLILLFNWYMMWSYLDVFWGVNGLISLKTSIDYGALRFSLFDMMPNDPRVPTLLALINVMGCLGVIFGLFTRTSLVITFITLLSFQNRNDFILNSGDIVLRNILFFMMFSAAGEAYSLDRWIKDMRMGVQRGVRVMERPWALRLIQIQFCIIYVATVLFKIKGTHWVDGTAVYIATRLDEFVRMPFPLLNNLALIKFMTWSTLLVELAMGTLVWFKDLRYWVLLAGIGLHIGIELVMSIPMFEWVMIVTMLSLVDPYDLIKVEEWARRKIKMSPGLKVATLDTVS